MLSFDDQLSPHFKRDVYEVTDAIKLFCHTFTLALLEPDTNEGPIDVKDREYLMMSLKPPIPNEKLYVYIPKSYDTFPLVVKFSNGCVPFGCFSSTISCLLSKYGWEVIRKGSSSKCLASNIASSVTQTLPSTLFLWTSPIILKFTSALLLVNDLHLPTFALKSGEKLLGQS